MPVAGTSELKESVDRILRDHQIHEVDNIASERGGRRFGLQVFTEQEESIDLGQYLVPQGVSPTIANQKIAQTLGATIVIGEVFCNGNFQLSKNKGILAALRKINSAVNVEAKVITDFSELKEEGKYLDFSQNFPNGDAEGVTSHVIIDITDLPTGKIQKFSERFFEELYESGSVSCEITEVSASYLNQITESCSVSPKGCYFYGNF